MAPGHATIIPKVSPSSLVSPWWPSSMAIIATAWQLPLVGRALNWQGQP